MKENVSLLYVSLLGKTDYVLHNRYVKSISENKKSININFFLSYFSRHFVFFCNNIKNDKHLKHCVSKKDIFLNEY